MLVALIWMHVYHRETQQVYGKWYYMDQWGAMTTGWQYIGGSWYYMNEGGAMQTGWLYLGGNWYYLNSSGAMVTGSHYIDGKWYSFNGSGVMQKVQSKRSCYGSYADKSGKNIVKICGFFKYSCLTILLLMLKYIVCGYISFDIEKNRNEKFIFPVSTFRRNV